MTHPLSCHLTALVPDTAHPGRDRALALIADAGFDHVGLPPGIAAEDLASLRAALRATALTPIPFAVQRADADVSNADPEVREAGRRMLRSALDQAETLGAAHVTGVPYAAYGLASAWSEQSRARAADAVGAFAADAAARGIRVTFEVLNRYESSAINTVDQALSFRAATETPALGVHLDGFHLMIEEPDPVDAIRRAGRALGMLEFGQSGRGSLRQGGVDVAALVAAAVAGGFDGPIAFEAFSRSRLPGAMADRLRVWRDTDGDPADVLREAASLLRSASAREGSA